MGTCKLVRSHCKYVNGKRTLFFELRKYIVIKMHTNMCKARSVFVLFLLSLCVATVRYVKQNFDFM